MTSKKKTAGLLSAVAILSVLLVACSLTKGEESSREEVTTTTPQFEVTWIPSVTSPVTYYTLPKPVVSTVAVTSEILPTEDFSILSEGYKYLSVEESHVTGDMAEKRVALYTAANIKGAKFGIDEVVKTVSEVDTYNKILNQKIGIFLKDDKEPSELMYKEKLKQGFLPIVKLVNSGTYVVIYGYDVINGDIRFKYFNVLKQEQKMETTYYTGIAELVCYLNVTTEIKDNKMYDFYYWKNTLNLAKERSQDDTRYNSMWAVSTHSPMYKSGNDWFVQISKSAYDILKEGEKENEVPESNKGK